MIHDAINPINYELGNNYNIDNNSQFQNKPRKCPILVNLDKIYVKYHLKNSKTLQDIAVAGA